MDRIEAVTVTRRTDGGWLLDFDERFGAPPRRVFMSASAVDPARDGVCVEVAHVPLELPPLENAARAYFLLETADEALIVAQRALPLSGGVNFRDLGGYRAADGRRVCWGRLFRSGHMAGLSAADKQQFAALDIRTVCDFRLAEERENEKTALPGPPELHILGIPPGVGDKHFFHRLFASSEDPADVVDAMHRMMACLVRDAAPHYGKLFEVLLAAPAGALLLNCSAGKERTGVASALVLAALGVPRETIMYDFMLSATWFPADTEVPRVLKKYAVSATGAAGKALIMPLLETRRSYLEAAFAAIDEDFGSVDAFLRAHYALGEAEFKRLRELYTA